MIANIPLLLLAFTDLHPRVEGASLRPGVPMSVPLIPACYMDKYFVEFLSDQPDRTIPTEVYQDVLEVIARARYFTDHSAICKQVEAALLRVKAEFAELYTSSGHGTKFRLATTQGPTKEEFKAKLAGYMTAMSAHINGPYPSSKRGLGKLKTMTVVDYAILGDDVGMSSLMTPREIHLVDSMLMFFDLMLEDGSSSSGRSGAGSRMSPPPTPYEGKGASSVRLTTPVAPRYKPGRDGWYDLLFGVVGNLLTWEDEELIILYDDVLELLMRDVEAINPNSRSSIYRSLMFVNEQLYLDRTIGLATNEASETIDRINTYKRILRRLLNNRNPFVFSFEQIELIDLYEGFLDSSKYTLSNDFASKDSIKRNILLYGVLFGLEFDAPNNILANLVVTIWQKVVNVFPTSRSVTNALGVDEALFTLVCHCVDIIRRLRRHPETSMAGLEAELLGYMGPSHWNTPVDVAVKYLTEEYCLGLYDRQSQTNCQQMILILKRQLLSDMKWITPIKMIELNKEGIVIPLVKVDKIVLDKVSKSVPGTEDLLTALDVLITNIETKLRNPAPLNLSEEIMFLETLLASSGTVEGSESPVESPSESFAKSYNTPRSHKDKRREGRKKGRKSGNR